jgi:hypothetical protein
MPAQIDSPQLSTDSKAFRSFLERCTESSDVHLSIAAHAALEDLDGIGEPYPD